MSSQIEVRIKAIDEASKTVAQASAKIKKEMTEVEATNKRVVAAQKETTKSSRDLITGFSGVATSAFSLYSAFDQIQNAQISLDNANLQVKSSLAAVENAQKRVNESIIKYGVSSEEASSAARDLQLAQERSAIAFDQANQAQSNVNKTMVQAALQIIPTAVTMVDSLSRAWKNFPDMSGMLSNLSSNIGGVGSAAATAALGVGALVAGFLLVVLGFASIHVASCPPEDGDRLPSTFVPIGTLGGEPDNLPGMIRPMGTPGGGPDNYPGCTTILRC